ncbi:hypothetical protein B0T09DRAFT_344311 [Sordaria sp. MPI-SDFR-AT-0083]|nr:hypothetical protein B0T09DRAFT_344311 [Sordaria sp. MPI-SDFR-AT-0083]
MFSRRSTHPPFWGLSGHHEELMLHPRGTPRGGGNIKPPTPQFSFPQFPRLPRDVRLRIWEMTVVPRIVEVRVNYSKNDADHDQASKRFTKVTPKGYEVFPLFSSTPVPAPLQACQEARNYLGQSEVGYEKAFWDLDLPVARKEAGDEPKPENEEPTSETEKRSKPEDTEQHQQQTELSPSPDPFEEPPRHRPYVWMNFHKDMLSLGPSPFHHFLSYSSKIKALRFQQDLLSNEEVADLRLISKFTNIKELHIICAYGQEVDDWAGVETELEMKFPIPRWDVLVIAPGDDLVVDAYEIDIYDKEEERRRKSQR